MANSGNYNYEYEDSLGPFDVICFVRNRDYHHLRLIKRPEKGYRLQVTNNDYGADYQMMEFPVNVDFLKQVLDTVTNE